MLPVIEQQAPHQGAVIDTKDGFDLIDCAVCGFAHVNPLPSPEALEAIYRHEYYTDEKPLYIEHFQQDLEWWNLAYGDRYASFEAELPAGRRRLLDIGSGPGYFLLHGEHRGWDVTGIEPSARAAAHSRSLGLNIVEDFLDERSADSLGQFDAIHLSEVLEHIPDPAQMLQIARRLLAPGGLLCVVVPNDYNPFQRALRAVEGVAPWWVAPPHHLNYFNFDSLEALVKRCGMRVYQREATFPIDMFLLMGEHYVGNDALGRACHGKRKRFETLLAAAGMNDLKRALLKNFAELGIGREACVYARRDDAQPG